MEIYIVLSLDLHKLATDMLHNYDSYARMLWVAVASVASVASWLLAGQIHKRGFTLTQDNVNHNVSS